MLNKIISSLLLLVTVSVTRAQLYLTSGETVTVSTTGDLVLQEDLNNNGTINNLTINGSNALSILGTGTIGNLIINKTAGTATGIGGKQTITGTLSSTSGNLAAGGYFTIAPGAAVTGTYANLSGNFTLQQAISAQRGWRVFANPFTTSQTLSTVATNNGITINSTTLSGSSDARLYNNSTNVWSNATTTINANTAYGLFIRGLASEVSGLVYSNGPTAFNYGVSGTLNGDSYTVAAASTPANFTLVGNPFAAPVKTSALTNGTGIPYYVYTISVTGNGRTTQGSWSPVMSSSASTTIPVLGTVALITNGNYNINTSDILTSGTLQTGLFGTDPTIQNLQIQVEKGGFYQDKLFIRLDDKATDNSNDANDLLKFVNDNTNVYTIDKSANIRLGIDARKTLNTSIPLGISAVAGSYNFVIPNNSLPSSVLVTLQDNYLNTQTELKEGTSYDFAITSDTATKGENRFVLNATQKLVTPLPDSIANPFSVKVLGNIIQDGIVKVSITNSASPVTLAVFDITGKMVQQINGANGINRIVLRNISNGEYLLKISNGTNTVVDKIFKN
jgi:hypothetical protein